MIEGIVYLLIVDMLVGLLVADKLEILVDKNLVIVETYSLMKTSRWDFVIKKK